MHEAPLWLNRTRRFPRLKGAVRTDILIIGGGITGISAAYHCFEQRKSAVLIEKDLLATGTSGRGTGILLQGFDMDCADMVAHYGFRETKKIWDLTMWSLSEMKRVIRRLRIPCDFEQSGSLIAALAKRDLPLLRREAAARKRVGYPARFLEGETFRKFAPLGAAAAIHAPQDALMNQEKFVVGLAARLKKRVRIYEKSPARRIVRKDGGYLVRTPAGSVWAKKVVVAAGSWSPGFVKPAHRIRSYTAFEIATKPLSPAALRKFGWKKGHALWPLGRFYDYIRLTADRRMLVGGEDAKINLSGADAKRHFARLHAFLYKAFPGLPPLGVEYEWTGVVKGTPREFPEIGRRGNVFYGFAYGGHGLLMAFYVGGLLAHLAFGKPRRKFTHALFHKDAPVDRHLFARRVYPHT